MKTKTIAPRTTSHAPHTKAPARDVLEDALHAKKLAYERIVAEADALSPAVLLAYNLEPAYAAGIVQTAVARCAPFEKTLDGLDTLRKGLLLRLPVLALALRYTQRVIDSSSKPVDALPALLTEMTPKRLYLQAGLEMLAAAGVVDTNLVSGFRGPRTYKDNVDVCGAIVETYVACWEQIGGRIPVTREHLTALDGLADEMSLALGARERSASEVSQWYARRQRVATLLMRDYRELRFGMAFLRRNEGDAEAFAPSLYQFTRRTGAAKKDAVGEEPAQPASPTQDAKPASKPAGAKEPAKGAVSARPAPEDDDGPIELGPNGLPLVPQDDPFAKD